MPDGCMVPLIQFTKNGLYCEAGNFYVDPWQPVQNAVITHAHSDHARAGSANYLAHPLTVKIMQHRLGAHRYQALDYNQPIKVNNVMVSLHPAGHIPGSAQIRIEHKGEVWVAAGDYKTVNDGISEPLEPLRCNTFITESTFGLPIYRWKNQEDIFGEMLQWIYTNKAAGRCSVLIAYSLGKAQRVVEALRLLNEEIWAHGAVYNMQQTLIHAGLNLMPVRRVLPDTPKRDFSGGVIIAPPGAEASSWIRKFEPYEAAVCSGWMQVRGNNRRSKAGRGFVLSDHADWNGLLETVSATGAEKVYVTHGFQAVFSRYLNETGVESAEVITQYGSDDENVVSADDQNQENDNE